MAVCERHEEMVARLNNHGDRIKKLEISDATMGQKLESLTDSVKELVSWLKISVFSVCGAGVGFIIWYIQSK